MELFSGVTCRRANEDLRRLLGHIGTVDSHLYRTHDLRRGHAQDIAKNGGTFIQILRGGGWKSDAYKKYVDEEDMEDRAVAHAHAAKAAPSRQQQSDSSSDDSDSDIEE